MTDHDDNLDKVRLEKLSGRGRREEVRTPEKSVFTIFTFGITSFA